MAKRDKRFDLSFMALLSAVSFLLVRWAWIHSPVEEFTNDFENAYRITLGQRYGVDFITGIAPLSYFFLAKWIRFFGAYEWVIHANIYLWWIASLFVGWRLARELKASASLLAVALVFTAGISCPIYTYGNAYNYQAATFLGFSALATVRFLQSGAHFWLVFSGIASALTIFTKQNLGIFTLPAFLVALYYAPNEKRDANLARLLAAFAWIAGFVPAFAGVFLFLAKDAGIRETLTLLFVDGKAGKGGTVNILLRGLPRVVLPLAHGWGAGARLLEITVSATIGFFTLKTLSRAQKPKKEASRPEAPRRLFAVLVVGTLITMLPFPALREATETLSLWLKNTPADLIVQMLTIALFTAITWLVLHSRWEKKHALSLFLTAFTLFTLYASNVSASVYLWYSSPLTLPLALCLLSKKIDLKVVVVARVAAVFLVVIPAWTYCAPRFAPLSKMASHSFYRGLSTSPEGIRHFEEHWQVIRPLIEGRTTLWLVNGGPNSAYGGQPIATISTLFKDQYSSRVEARVFEGWNKKLPERIVYEPLMPAPNSKLFLPDQIEPWIRKRYDLVHRGTRDVWALKDEWR